MEWGHSMFISVNRHLGMRFTTKMGNLEHDKETRSQSG